MAEQKSPAFQFYFKDWRSSKRVSRMSFKERGMYLELLIEQWDKGPLPLAVKDLAECIGAKLPEFQKCWPAIRTCFMETADGWLNQRLEHERLKQQSRRERASDWGKKGAEKTWAGHTSQNGHPMGTPSQVERGKPSSPDSFAFASAIASASALAGASTPTSPPAPSARSKRPMFTGQRLTVFEWMVDELDRLLTPHTEGFDLHEWFFALDARCVREGIIPPPRDNGAWLKAECLAEAQRRGLPLKVASLPAEDTEAVFAALAKKGPSARP